MGKCRYLFKYIFVQQMIATIDDTKTTTTPDVMIISTERNTRNLISFMVHINKYMYNLVWCSIIKNLVNLVAYKSQSINGNIGPHTESYLLN